MSDSPIQHVVAVDVGAERAFELFADRLGDWWPLAYTFSGPECEHIGLEPRVGGRWFERSAGKEASWGEVRGYQRGEKLVLEFAVGADRRPTPPGESTEVEVRFTEAGPGVTRVEVEHRDFARHGKAGATLREGMSSAQGWPLILAEFRRSVRRARGV